MDNVSLSGDLSTPMFSIGNKGNFAMSYELSKGAGDGCGLIVFKSDGRLGHIRAPSKYPTLSKYMKIHGKVQGKNAEFHVQ